MHWKSAKKIALNKRLHTIFVILLHIHPTRLLKFLEYWK